MTTNKLVKGVAATIAITLATMAVAWRIEVVRDVITDDRGWFDNLFK